MCQCCVYCITDGQSVCSAFCHSLCQCVVNLIACSVPVYCVFFNRRRVSIVYAVTNGTLVLGILSLCILLQTVCQCAKLYADLVHTKLMDKGYYDDEGQFDVTEEVGPGCVWIGGCVHLCVKVLFV